MTLQLVQLGKQPPQRGPAAESYDFTGLFVEGRAMVLGIVDVETDVEYVLLLR